MDKISQLEKNQTDLINSFEEGEYDEWLTLRPTKLFLLQLDIDVEDLKEGWKNRTSEEHEQAKAVENYIAKLKSILDENKREESDNDDS